MRSVWILPFIFCAAQLVSPQSTSDGPSNEKAQKTYKQALEYLGKHEHVAALDSFKKPTSKTTAIASTVNERF
jgi:hypothetical protein